MEVNYNRISSFHYIQLVCLSVFLKQMRLNKNDKKETSEQENDLSKLKKKDLLEIMLKQGEEIDSLRAQVADLQAKLDNKEFELSQVGNIAEASLIVTNVFEEAQKAAVIYLKNVKRMAESKGADADE